MSDHSLTLQIAAEWVQYGWAAVLVDLISSHEIEHIEGNRKCNVGPHLIANGGKFLLSTGVHSCQQPTEGMAIPSGVTYPFKVAIPHLDDLCPAEL